MSTTPAAFAGLGPKVKAAYTKAVKSGAVLFTESEIEEADDADTGIPVSFTEAHESLRRADMTMTIVRDPVRSCSGQEAYRRQERRQVEREAQGPLRTTLH